MSNLLRLIVAGLLVAVVATSAAAGPPPVDPETESVQKVNRAIDKGVQYLRDKRKGDTQWEGFWLNQIGGVDGGVTALCTLALLNCGVKADDKVITEPLAYLRKVPAKSTYVVSLVIMVLTEARNPKDLPLIQSHVNWLLTTARKDRAGNVIGWSYPFENLDVVDASNTQYALLGLYAGKQAGAKIPDVAWQQLRALYKAAARPDGDRMAFWYYAPDEPKASFTMTVAGVCGLLIARMGLNDSGQKLNATSGVAEKCGQYDDAEFIRKGMNWIGNKFAFEKAEGSMSLFYNMYGIERVGRLSGQRFVGKFDWYREGCDFLVKIQAADGSWTRKGELDELDGVNVISTSFGLLFLSKGRSPVLISKLAHGAYTMPERGVLVEKSEKGEIVGWNRKQNDARNVTDFCARELFNNIPLGWQVYDPRRKEFKTDQELRDEVGTLVQSPILYLNGHTAPVLDDQQKKILKMYVEEGGFVLAEACCGSDAFATGFRALIKELFPNNELKPVPPEHALWRAHYAVAPTDFRKLECLEVGCRTVVVFSGEPVSGFWEESKYMPTARTAANRGESAFMLATNIIAYATGKEPPKQRLTRKVIADAKTDRNPPNGFVQPVQLKLGEAAPAPAAMRNLAAYLRDNAKLDIVPAGEAMSPGDDALFKFKFLYAHGRNSFTLSDDDANNLKANLQNGGLLLADACCGSEKFDTAFRAAVEKMFPDRKLEPIPTDDLLYSEKLNGKGRLIDVVERREKAATGGAKGEDGFEKLPPKLEGIKVDGRWAVVYSRYDIGCALEGHKSSDCLGHTPDSARKLAAAAVLYALKR